MNWPTPTTPPLPQDVLVLIFQNLLPDQIIASAAGVSKDWHRASQSPRIFTSWSFLDSDRVMTSSSYHAYKVGRYLGQVKSVELNDIISSSAFIWLMQRKNFERFSHISNSYAFRTLYRDKIIFPHITDLDLSLGSIGPYGLVVLARHFPSLRKLQVVLTDRGSFEPEDYPDGDIPYIYSVADFSALTQLETLSAHCTSVLKIDFTTGKLRHLELTGLASRYDSNSPFTFKRVNESLESLVIRSDGIDLQRVSDALLHTPNLTQLHLLSVNPTIEWNYRVDERVLLISAIQALTKLRVLKFSMCSLTKEMYLNVFAPSLVKFYCYAQVERQAASKVLQVDMIDLYESVHPPTKVIGLPRFLDRTFGPDADVEMAEASASEPVTVPQQCPHCRLTIDSSLAEDHKIVCWHKTEYPCPLRGLGCRFWRIKCNNCPEFLPRDKYTAHMANHNKRRSKVSTTHSFSCEMIEHGCEERTHTYKACPKAEFICNHCFQVFGASSFAAHRAGLWEAASSRLIASPLSIALRARSALLEAVPAANFAYLWQCTELRAWIAELAATGTAAPKLFDPRHLKRAYSYSYDDDGE